MSVWLCIPSKRSPEEADPVLRLWRERGYKIALWCDSQADALAKKADIPFASDVYPGYARAVNQMISQIMASSVVHVEPKAEWFVTGGDDVEPDANHSAEEIARQCSDHFYPLTIANMRCDLWGVMQPTGDRWGDAQGAYIDRVAGSPWIGREFARRMYGGNGPYWPEYTHMGVDEELQAVAEKMGVFWQRPDLFHFHRHWGRPRAGGRLGMADRMPEFLKKANSAEEWQRYKRIFAERKAAGFPGHEPR